MLQPTHSSHAQIKKIGNQPKKYFFCLNGNSYELKTLVLCISLPLNTLFHVINLIAISEISKYRHNWASNMSIHM